MEVVLVRWPAEAERRERLRAAGAARLLLVEEGADPPVVDDCREDWVRVPVDDRDIDARIAGLDRRRHQGQVPRLDDTVLHHGDRWVALPPIEARLAAALLDRFGRVVSREAVVDAGWPGGLTGRNALDVHMLRLRRRLEPVGLRVLTIRSRGYVLQTAGGGT